YLSLPKTSSRIELLAVREIISHSARSSGSSLFRWVCFAFMVLISALFLLIRTLILRPISVRSEPAASADHLSIANSISLSGDQRGGGGEWMLVGVRRLGLVFWGILCGSFPASDCRSSAAKFIHRQAAHAGATFKDATGQRLSRQHFRFQPGACCSDIQCVEILTAKYGRSRARHWNSDFGQLCACVWIPATDMATIPMRDPQHSFLIDCHAIGPTFFKRIHFDHCPRMADIATYAVIIIGHNSLC